jgi:tetratricopeptide (TPR) repeat protein
MEPPTPGSTAQGEAPPSPERRPLLALRGADGDAPLLSTKAGGEIERWIASGGIPLWVRGATGSGRSTICGAAIRAVLAAAETPFLGAFRFEANPGTRLEEVLSEFGQFLQQLGIGELEAVLDQRTSLAAKVSILIEVLRRHPVIFWIDDFENVTAAGGADPGLPVRFFARGWPALEGSAGRLLLVTEGEGPDGLHAGDTSARLCELGPENSIRLEELAARLEEALPLGDGIAPRLDGGAAGPLEVRLRHLALAALDPAARPAAAIRLRDARLPGLAILIRDFLSDEGRKVLDGASTFRAPLGRGSLRSLSSLDEGAMERAVEELSRFGLASRAAEDDGWSFHIHPAVAAATEERLRREDPEGWKEIQKRIGLHLFEVGNRTGGIWALLRSRERLFACGLHTEAYEVQKTFLEEILRRGLNELARLLLVESAATNRGGPRAVALGNLAIIHKNEGNLDEAVRLYEQVREEFEKLQDLPNIARVYHQIGNTHYLRGDLDLAIENYGKSLEISLELNERSVSAATKIQIANVQYIRGQHVEALESYRETLSLADEIGDRAIATAIHLQIGQLLISMKRLTEAEEELLEARRDAEGQGDRRNQIKVDQLLGIVAAERRDHDQAVAYLESAAELAGSIGDPLEMAACFLRIGIFEADHLQFTRAVASLFRAMDLLDAAPSQTLAGASGDRQSYRTAAEERLREIALQVGPEVYGRILKNLGRDDRIP